MLTAGLDTCIYNAKKDTGMIGLFFWTGYYQASYPSGRAHGVHEKLDMKTRYRCTKQELSLQATAIEFLHPMNES